MSPCLPKAYAKGLKNYTGGLKKYILKALKKRGSERCIDFEDFASISIHHFVNWSPNSTIVKGCHPLESLLERISGAKQAN